MVSILVSGSTTSTNCRQ